MWDLERRALTDTSYDSPAVRDIPVLERIGQNVFGFLGSFLCAFTNQIIQQGEATKEWLEEVKPNLIQFGLAVCGNESLWQIRGLWVFAAINLFLLNFCLTSQVIDNVLSAKSTVASNFCSTRTFGQNLSQPSSRTRCSQITGHRSARALQPVNKITGTADIRQRETLELGLAAL